MHEGKVLDGRNRLRACVETGTPPVFREWDGPGTALDYVISMNLHRRHLDPTQLAMVAARMATLPIEKIGFDRRPVEKLSVDYATMSLEEIAVLPIPRLANQEGAHVYLWVTHRFLPWGVRYECVLTWIKPTAQPLWRRYLTEPILFGKIGSLPPLRKGEAVCFNAPQQRHSHKPDQFFDLVRRVSPEPRLTMFDGDRAEFTHWGVAHE